MAELNKSKENVSNEKQILFNQITEYSCDMIVIHSNQKVLYINDAGARFLKADKKDIIGANIVQVFTKKYRNFIVDRIEKATTQFEVGERVDTEIHCFDGMTVDVDLYCCPVEYGDQHAIQSIIRDITSHKNTERELIEVITPIVPISKGVAVLPLIGSIDAERARQFQDIIPQKIQGQNIEYLIIDFSGIYDIDQFVIDFIYKLNAVMNILGVKPIFTGIMPKIAKKVIETFPNMKAFETRRNVQQALEYLPIWLFQEIRYYYREYDKGEINNDF